MKGERIGSAATSLAVVRGQLFFDMGGQET